MMKFSFLIHKIDTTVQIFNESDMNLLIFTTPQDRRKKLFEFDKISPKSFKIYTDDQLPNIDKLNFRFELTK